MEGGCGLAKMRIVSLMYHRQRQRRIGLDDVLYRVPCFRWHFLLPLTWCCCGLNFIRLEKKKKNGRKNLCKNETEYPRCAPSSSSLWPGNFFSWSTTRSNQRRRRILVVRGRLLCIKRPYQAPRVEFVKSLLRWWCRSSSRDDSFYRWHLWKY